MVGTFGALYSNAKKLFQNPYGANKVNVSVSSKSSDLSFNAKASRANDVDEKGNREVTGDFTLGRTFAVEGYKCAVNVNSSHAGKTNVSGNVTGVYPGVKLGFASDLYTTVTPDKKDNISFNGSYANDLINTSVDVKQECGKQCDPDVKVEGLVGAEGFNVGGNVLANFRARNVKEYSYGASYEAADFSLVAQVAKNKNHNLNVAFVHQVDKQTTVGAELVQNLVKADFKQVSKDKEGKETVVEYKALPTPVITFGLKYVLDQYTTAVKVDTTGQAAVSLSQSLNKTTTLTLSGNLNPNDLRNATKLSASLDLAL